MMKRIRNNLQLTNRIFNVHPLKGRPDLLGMLDNLNDVGNTKKNEIVTAMSTKSLRIISLKESYPSTIFRGKRSLSTDAQNYDPSDNNPETMHNMKLYNTMTESLEPLPSADLTSPSSSQKMRGMIWYTCGPTTYAPAHLGHARTYVCLDILRRVMMASRSSRQVISAATGSVSKDDDDTLTVPAPLFVLNITDVDDKIIAAAAADENDCDPLQLARKYELEFWRDWDALNCLRPNIVTRVTEHVDSHIVPYIKCLVEKGMAYEYVDGVYFDILAYNERMNHLTKYGKLAPPAAAHGMEDILRNNNNNIDDNHYVNPTRQKRDPRDFVLWKKRKGQEALYWSSPWGDGRPGWHIECSAMIEAVQDRFRDSHQFLVHAGGIDLKFPHHTNEIAQSEAYLGVGEWIPHWVHTGHLYIDGLKMSKSLKNFVSIEDFLNDDFYGSDSNNKAVDGLDETNIHNPATTTITSGGKSNISRSFQNILECPVDDFRLWCLGLSGSYRGPSTFSNARIKEARSVRQKILRFLLDGETWIHSNEKEEAHLSTKVLHDEETELFKVTDLAKRRGLSALENDLDGSAFVSELLVIADCGMRYIKKKSRGPVEPIISCIAELRYLLRLVGFTEVTTEAGTQAGNSKSNSNSKIYEDTLIKTLVRFRSTVRNIALDERCAQNTEISEGMKKILSLSDELRDSILPEMGVQLIDSDDKGTDDDWRCCLPLKPIADRQKSKGMHDDSYSSRRTDLMSIPLTNFFRVGQYGNKFSEYTEDGIPTHNADGSEISKRLLKKLLKKRDRHRSVLDKLHVPQ